MLEFFELIFDWVWNYSTAWRFQIAFAVGMAGGGIVLLTMGFGALGMLVAAIVLVVSCSIGGWWEHRQS